MPTCISTRTTIILLSLALVATPVFAGSTRDSKASKGNDDVQTARPRAERSDRTSATRSTRTTSVRATTTTEPDRDPRRANPQLRTYVPRVNRQEPVRDTRERFPQPKDDRPIIFVRTDPEENSVPMASDRPLEASDIEALLERNEVYVKQKTYKRDVPEERVVFCVRSLYEYHLDRDCPMLGDVTPTPKKYEAARADRYSECSVCKRRHK